MCVLPYFSVTSQLHDDASRVCLEAKTSGEEDATHGKRRRPTHSEMGATGSSSSKPVMEFCACGAVKDGGLIVGAQDLAANLAMRSRSGEKKSAGHANSTQAPHPDPATATPTLSSGGTSPRPSRTFRAYSPRDFTSLQDAFQVSIR